MFAEPQSADGRRLGDLIESGAAWLGRRGVGDGRLLCEWLASAALGCRRTDLPLAATPPPEVVERLREGLRRLGAGEPIQYVVGDWDFRMLTLKTDKRALIPRPETEGLVSLVLEEPGVWGSGAPRICDIGTGTGAIALSLAYERPQCLVTAVDRQEAALSLARENAGRLGLASRVEFILGENCAGAAPGTFDAIVSNPPYIESAAVDALPPLIRDHEPRTALDGGPDGLDTLRGIIHDAAIALRRGGFLFLEIGDGQGDSVRSLMEDSGFSDVAILKDLAGLVRYARGRIE